jgi:hypothetical protein
MARACGVLQLDRVRAYRWAARRADGTLEDKPGGGNSIHGLVHEFDFLRR